MPELGEIRKGGELGYKHIHQKFVWATCPYCGEKRWVNYHVGRKEPVNPKKGCVNCANSRMSEIKLRNKEKLWNWKGGRILRPDGYITIRVYPNEQFHEMVDGKGYVVGEHCQYHHRDYVNAIQKRVNSLESRVTILEAELAVLKTSGVLL